MFFIKDREKALRRYDFFLIFLAVASVGLIVAEERMDFTEAEEGIFGLVDTAVWLIFVGDYFSRLFLAGDKKLYVKTHIIELIAILPFDALFKGLRSLRLFRMLRSTRALRILRLIRLAAYFGKKVHNLDRPIEFDPNREMTIDDAAYGSYRNAYIKKDGTEEISSWQILANRLKRINDDQYGG